MRLEQDQIFGFCEDPANEDCIKLGRDLQDSHKMHITGLGYKEYLTQIEGYEDGDDKQIRDQLSQPATVDIMKTVIDELTRWKNTQGTNKKYHLDKEKENDFNDMLEKVWKDSSLDDFINAFFDKALFTEFNGFTVVTKPKIENGKALKEDIEIPYDGSDLDPYLIFVAIEDVRDFRVNGDKVEYLIWKTDEITDESGNRIADILRAIDDSMDRVIRWDDGKKDGEQCELISEIENELEYVPAVQVSNFKHEIKKDEVKDSPVSHLIPMLNRYLSKDSFHTITEVKHAFPKLAAVGLQCKECDGTGVKVDKNTGKQVKCSVCNGKGWRSPFKHGSFMALADKVEEGHVFPPGFPATYITPDNDSVRYGSETLDKLKERILFAGTGNKAIVSEEIARTATESVINHKSLEDRIGEIIDNIEMVETFLTDTIAGMHNSFKGSYQGCTVKYGRKLNLRDENTVLTEIKDSKAAGMPESHIENLQKELIASRYKNSPEMLDRYLLLADIEPLCGYTAKEVLEMRDYLDPKILGLKINFNERIDQFEQEQGTVTEFQPDQDHDKRVIEIRTKLLEYGDDFSAGGSVEPGRRSDGQDPDTV